MDKLLHDMFLAIAQVNLINEYLLNLIAMAALSSIALERLYCRRVHLTFELTLIDGEYIVSPP